MMREGTSETHEQFIDRMRQVPGRRPGDVIRSQAVGFPPVYMRVVESDSPLGIDFEPLPLYRTKRFFRRLLRRGVTEEVFSKRIPGLPDKAKG